MQQEHKKQLQERIESLKEIFEEVEYVQQSNDELNQQLQTKDEELQTLKEKHSDQEEEILELRMKIKKLEESGPTQLKTETNALSLTPNVPIDQRFLQISSLLQKALKLSGIPNQTSSDVDSSIPFQSAEEVNQQLEREKKAHQRDLELLTQEKKRYLEEREYNSVLTTRSRDLAIKLDCSESRYYTNQQVVRENHIFLSFVQSSIEAILQKWPDDWFHVHRFAEELKHITGHHNSKKGLFSAFDKRGSLHSSAKGTDLEPQNVVDQLTEFEEEL